MATISPQKARLIKELYAGFVDFGAAQFLGDDLEVSAALFRVKQALEELEQTIIATCSTCGSRMESSTVNNGRSRIAYRCPRCGETVVRETPKEAPVDQASQQRVERVPLTHREVSLVLAALRNLQMDLQHDGAPQVYNIMTDWERHLPPTLEEIDELCERIDCAGAGAL